MLVGALQPDLVLEPLPDPTLVFVRFVGESFEAVEALVEDVVDGRVERGEPHVLDDDGAARELEGGPAEHFRVVVGRRDLLSEPHRFRRIARIVRVIKEGGADRLGCGGPAEGRAGESSHFGLGGAAGYGRRVSSELLRSTRGHLGSSNRRSAVNFVELEVADFLRRRRQTRCSLFVGRRGGAERDRWKGVDSVRGCRGGVAALGLQKL